MPVIEILESRIGPLVRVPGSGPLMDLCDEAHAPVDFSCRAASCGTCRVEVLAGGDLLDPPRADEIEVLGASPLVHRLACQAVVRPGPGLLRLRWVGR
jgi:ferredoxin